MYNINRYISPILTVLLIGDLKQIIR